jgi:hypothetical protein
LSVRKSAQPGAAAGGRWQLALEAPSEVGPGAPAAAAMRDLAAAAMAAARR